jgi:hypothetical protein
MRYVLSGRLHRPCPLAPAELVTLVIREWEVVVAWLASGRALAYGRVGADGSGALVVEVASEAEAWRLAESLPFAPYSVLEVRAAEEVPDAAALVGVPRT